MIGKSIQSAKAEALNPPPQKKIIRHKNEKKAEFDLVK